MIFQMLFVFFFGFFTRYGQYAFFYFYINVFLVVSGKLKHDLPVLFIFQYIYPGHEIKRYLCRFFLFLEQLIQQCIKCADEGVFSLGFESYQCHISKILSFTIKFHTGANQNPYQL